MQNIEKEDLTNRALSDMVESTLVNTAAHGIPNAVRASTRARKLAWILLVIGSLAMFIWQSTELAKEYYEYGVSVHVDLEYTPTVKYPAVTVCNMNAVTKSALERFKSLNEILSSSSEDVAFSSASNSASKTSASNVTGYQDWDNLNYTSADGTASAKANVIEILSELDYDMRRETGHEFSDMLLKCTFAGLPCSPLNFTQFHNYLYGNCFTFNSGLSGTIQDSSIAGPLYGITLEVYVEEAQYIPTLQQASGMRVLVHDQGVMPFPEDGAISVSPGQETFIGVNKVIIDRLSHPYTNCSAPSTSSIFSQKFALVEYSIQACQKSCLFKEVFDRCGCAYIQYRYNDSIQPCLSGNISQHKCVLDAERKYKDGTLKCPCTLPCREIQYKTAVSFAAWPITEFESAVLDGISQISDKLAGYIQDNDNFIEKNVAKVNIYFNNLQHEYIYQTPAYSIYNLLSDLGGQVGLWIGVSVLTTFEFLELVFDVGIFLSSKCRAMGNRINHDGIHKENCGK